MKMIFTKSELMTLHELIDRKIQTEYENITDSNIDKYVEMVALKAKINALYKMMNPSIPTPKTIDTDSLGIGTVTLPYKPMTTTNNNEIITTPKEIDVSQMLDEGAKQFYQLEDNPKSLPFDENKITETVRVRN